MNFTSTTDTFCLAWTGVTAKRREKLIAMAFDEAGVYADPLVQISGRAALNAHIETMTAQRGGVRLVRTGTIDHHHGHVRFCCQVIESDGCAAATVVFYAELAPCSARLVKVIAFRGLPEADPSRCVSTAKLALRM